MAGSHEIPQDDAEPSTAQRLARRVIDRVTTRLHERYAEYRDGGRSSRRGLGRIAARLQTRFQCRRNEPEPCEEKPPLRKPHRWLVILNAINRGWQSLCAVVFYASFMALLFDSNMVTNVASQAIERLVRYPIPSSDRVAPDLHVPRPMAPSSPSFSSLCPGRARPTSSAGFPSWPSFWTA